MAGPRPHLGSAAGRERKIALTRRRQALGLVLIAGLILLIAVLRTPAHMLFPTGWWRF
jgi:hypothetical protein